MRVAIFLSLTALSCGGEAEKPDPDALWSDARVCLVGTAESGELGEALHAKYVHTYARRDSDLSAWVPWPRGCVSGWNADDFSRRDREGVEVLMSEVRTFYGAEDLRDIENAIREMDLAVPDAPPPAEEPSWPSLRFRGDYFGWIEDRFQEIRRPERRVGGALVHERPMGSLGVVETEDSFVVFFQGNVGEAIPKSERSMVRVLGPSQLAWIATADNALIVEDLSTESEERYEVDFADDGEPTLEACFDGQTAHFLVGSGGHLRWLRITNGEAREPESLSQTGAAERPHLVCGHGKLVVLVPSSDGGFAVEICDDGGCRSTDGSTFEDASLLPQIVITETTVAMVAFLHRTQFPVCEYGVLGIDGPRVAIVEDSWSLFPCGERLWVEEAGRLRIGRIEYDLLGNVREHEYLHQSEDGIVWETTGEDG